MPARTGAESREAAAHRDAGEVPGRPALAGRGPDTGSAGTCRSPSLLESLKLQKLVIVFYILQNHYH